MLDAPKTLEEAEKYIYGAWAGLPTGTKYNPQKCAYEVFTHIGRQCSRKNGHGAEGLYCKQHAKIV